MQSCNVATVSRSKLAEALIFSICCSAVNQSESKNNSFIIPHFQTEREEEVAAVVRVKTAEKV